MSPRQRDVPAAVRVEDGRQADGSEIGAMDDLVADGRAVGRSRLVASDDEREARLRRAQLHDPVAGTLVAVEPRRAV